MSTANDVNTLWASVNQTQAAARTRRKEKNLAILRASGLTLIYRNANDMVIPGIGYPVCEFWTQTSRWKYNGRHILGDATEFLAWLERKRKP
jgi:hypothetical protein